MPVWRMKVGWANFTDLAPNFVVISHNNVPWAIEKKKGMQIDRLHPHEYKSWKFGEDRLGTFWGNWSERGPLEETAADHYSVTLCLRKKTWRTSIKTRCFGHRSVEPTVHVQKLIINKVKLDIFLHWISFCDTWCVSESVSCDVSFYRVN